VLGSPKYMSPEQVVGKLTDQRSDIFSLGVMLYEMLTGQAPFAGENVNAIMYQTLNSVPPPPSSISPHVPEMLNFIVAKALAKKLEYRYQDTKEFAADLYACRDRLPRAAGLREIVKPDTPANIQRSENISAAQHVDTSEDESKPVATLGLSSAFDSAAATMRLAALTGSKEDLEEFSRTFKMPVPDIDELNKLTEPIVEEVKPKIEPPIFSKPKVVPEIVLSQDKPADLTAVKNGKILLFVVVVLMLLGIFSVFLFGR